MGFAPIIHFRVPIVAGEPPVGRLAIELSAFGWSTCAWGLGLDLVLSGHAHGGQVRIPLLVNGLCAPNQGWFPKYAGGRYDVDGTVMLVSRGLSNQAQMGVPRVFNRPEWLIVELK